MGTINHILTRAVISGREVNKDAQSWSKLLDHFSWICCNLLSRMPSDQCPLATWRNSEYTLQAVSSILWNDCFVVFCPIIVILREHNHSHHTNTLFNISRYLLIFYGTLEDKNELAGFSTPSMKGPW